MKSCSLFFCLFYPSRTMSRLLIIICISLISGGSASFKTYKDNSGSYRIRIGEDEWLSSAFTSFHINGTLYSTADGSLKLKGTTHDQGLDSIGHFTKISYTYAAGQVGVGTSIRSYDGHDHMNIFSQEFPGGAMKTSVADQNGIVSAFPAFSIGTQNTSIGVLAYGDLMSGWTRLTIQKWKKGMKALPGGLYSGPLVLFDEDGHVVIISAFNHFTAASYLHDPHNNTIAWGIMGNVDAIPKGYTLETIVYYSDLGINKAMEQWGEVLMRYYGRTSAARDTDVTINYLGYYTDNGAYYYHQTEPNKDYERTLFDVQDDSYEKNIPYRYLQLDDWWYFIETSKTSYGAVTEWEPMYTVFPHGLQYLYDVMKLPIIAHNRYWSYKTPYAKQNGGSWDFLIDSDSGMALPMDEEFWDWLFYKSKEWGLVTYEQDFMCTQMEKIKALNTNITLAETWLRQMGTAATRYNLKLQYCMALPREILAALEVPAASQARASSDYVSATQWKIGITSLFLHSLNIAPFKDNFWTTKVQPGNPYKRTEVNPDREAIVALLSTGPVGVSDKCGLTNTSITKRLSRSDGLLLKPGRPATAINPQIMESAFQDGIGPDGEVWYSVYFVSSLVFGVVFASELKSPYTLTAKDAGLVGEFNGFDWATYAMDSLDAPVSFSNQPIKLDECGADAVCVQYFSPRLNVSGLTNLVIMGELSKYVPMSPQRVSDIYYSYSDVTMLLKGAVHERVTMHFHAAKTHFTIDCTIGPTGKAMLSVKDKMCESI